MQGSLINQENPLNIHKRLINLSDNMINLNIRFPTTIHPTINQLTKTSYE